MSTLPDPHHMTPVGKGQLWKKNVVRLLPPQDNFPSYTSSPSFVYMPVRSPDVAPTPSPPPTEVRPFSSHVDACGPSPIDARGSSPVLTSTPSPSPALANMPTDEDATNLAMENPSPAPLMIVLWLR